MDKAINKNTDNKSIIKFLTTTNEYNQHYYGLITTDTNPYDDRTYKPLVIRSNPSDVYTTFNKVDLNSNNNLFISKNTLKTSIVSNKKIRDRIEDGFTVNTLSTKENTGKYGQYTINCSYDNVFGLTNIVIDIDCHDGLSPEEMKEVKENFFNIVQDYIADNTIPEPTLIDWSGRGYHIWYSIKEESTNLKWLYTLVVESLIEKFKLIIKDNIFTLSDFSVDTTNSKNICGLIRVPGSQNPNSTINPEICSFTELRYTLDELKEFLNVIITKSNFYSESEEYNNLPKRNEKHNTKSSKSNIVAKRYYAIKNFIKKHKASGSENRHNLLHLMYNYGIQILDKDTAAMELTEANSHFTHPLRQNELNSIMRTIDNHGTYKYKNDTLCDKMFIDANEATEWGIIGQHKAMTNKKSNKKDERNKKIIQIYCETGCIATVMKMVNVCRNTVKKVLSEHTELVHNMKIKLRNATCRRVFNNFLNTKNVVKAAKAGKCSVYDAIEIIDHYSPIRRELLSVLNNDFIEIIDMLNKEIKRNHNKFNVNILQFFNHLVQEYNIEYDKDTVYTAVAPYIQKVRLS